MKKSIEWKVGGQQGEGVDSTGELFAKTLVKSGFSVSTYKHFMSRIKGGHTNYKMKVTKERNYYAGEKVDILLALDKEALSHNENELRKGSIVIMDGKEQSIETHEKGYVVAIFPLKEFATEIGNPLAKNMIALGISSALINLKTKFIFEYIEEIFAKKGDKIIESNKKAIEKGYELTRQYLSDFITPLDDDFDGLNVKNSLFISGNEATAFGSFMAGCRYLSAYPITPATEVMEWLANELPSVGGTVMQVEDEIAGICCAIGASYTGVRAMTSTSGPGLSLKTEALGMAAIAEVPLVIVNSQRGGPSTGLPTKHEQSDLQHMIYGTHGEIPRIVVYPSTIEDAFYVAAESFNLAEKYQCPVIIALDLGLSMNKMTIDELDPNRVKIDRGKLLTNDEAKEFDENHFKRYRLTDDGISPRPIPGDEHAVHTTSSNEHNESGYISEDTSNRINMMDKRLNKIKNASLSEPFKIENSKADTLLVGMGSNFGLIKETCKGLTEDGFNVGHLHIQQLFPLPVDELEKVFHGKDIITIENNFNGQLLNWLRQHFPIHKNSHSIKQYDGNPFESESVIKNVKELIN